MSNNIATKLADLHHHLTRHPRLAETILSTTVDDERIIVAVRTSRRQPRLPLVAAWASTLPSIREICFEAISGSGTLPIYASAKGNLGRTPIKIAAFIGYGEANLLTGDGPVRAGDVFPVASLP